MRTVGGLRQIAAGDLVRSLRAGLHVLEAVGDGVVDGLVVARLEVQKRVMLDAAPVPSEEGVAADEIQCAGLR